MTKRGSSPLLVGSGGLPWRKIFILHCKMAYSDVMDLQSRYLEQFSFCSTDADLIFHGREALLVPNRNVQNKTSNIVHFNL